MSFRIAILCFVLTTLTGSAQVTLFDQTFYGGVVTRSFSPDVSSADSTGIQWDFSFPEGSTIVKAYLIAGRQGDADPLDIKLNAFRVRFDDLTQVTPSFLSEFYGDSTTITGAVEKVAAVHVADITTIVRPETDGMYLSIPRQGIVTRRYSDFTLFIAYQHPDAEPIHSTILLNTQSFSKPVLNYSLPISKYACGDFAFGFSAGYVCNNTFDKISVKANGTFLGDIGGPEEGEICAGPGAEFDVFDGLLTTPRFDDPDQKMDKNDLVSNLSTVVNSKDTALSIEMGTVSSNAVWALFVAYTTIPDTIAVDGPTSFCLPDTQTTLTAPDGYLNYIWSDGTRNQTVQPHSTGTWTVSMNTSSGCLVSLSQDIVVFAETELEVSVDTLDFGIVAGCTNSSEKEVTLYNKGDSAFVLQAAEFSNPAFFLASPLEGSLVHPGDSISILIQFSPGATGGYDGELSFETSPCASQHSIQLVGFGQTSLLRTSQNSIDYGYVAHCPETVHDSVVTVYNDLNEVVVLSRPNSLTGFEIVSPSFPIDVFARDSVDIVLRFAPNQPKRFSGVLSVPFRSITCSDTLSVSLTARSIQPRFQQVGPSLIADPLPMCELPSPTELRMYNSDLVPVIIQDIQYDTEYIRLDIDEFPIVIAPERSSTIPVTYLQDDVGSFIGTIAVMSGDNCIDTTFIDVGSTLVTPQLRLVDRINFGDQATCEGAEFERVLAVSNITKQGFGATIEDVVVEGPFTTTMQPGDTLRAQTTESFSVYFLPTESGSFEGRVLLTYGPCSLTDTIELSGAYGELSLESSEFVQFDAIAAGQTAQETGYIFNSGDVDIFLDSLSIPDAPFSVAYVSHDVPGFLPPGDSLVFLIAFTPQQSDSYESELIVHTSECVDTIQLLLYGDGFTPGAAPVVRAPMLEGEYGDTIDIPLLLDRRGALATVGESTLHATLELPYDQLYVLESSVGVLKHIDYPNLNRQRVVIDSVNIRAGVRQGDTLVKIRAVILFGELRYLPVDLSSGAFAWNQGVEIAQTVSGRVTISDYCFGFGIVRADPAKISLVYPNPAHSQLHVLFEDVPSEKIDVSLVDHIGRAVRVYTGITDAKEMVFRLPDGISSGLYTLVVSDPFGSTSTLIVVK